MRLPPLASSPLLLQLQHKVLTRSQKFRSCSPVSRKPLMPHFANFRFFACLHRRIKIKTLPFFTQQMGMASVADTLYGHLHSRNFGNVETSLSKVKPKLDSKCVMEVMNKCYPKDPQLSLRFFIWAGFQSGYRHSAYTYTKACSLLGIDKNPRIVCDVIESYEAEGCFVTANMFREVLRLCKEAELSDLALRVLRKMGSFNLHADTVMYNLVIRLCCKKGDVGMADELMREMSLSGLCPDLITYMTMIEGFCDVGWFEDAYSVLKVMQLHGCSPSSVVLSAILDGFCRCGSLERALELLDEMEKVGGCCRPNVVTYTSMIQCFCKRGRHAEALNILERMKSHGCLANHVTVFIFVESLCADDHMEEAYRMIDKFVVEHGVSYGECYNSLVISLIKTKKLEEAEKIFREMLSGKAKPNTLSCSLVLKELCTKDRVLDGFYLLDEIENRGYLSAIDFEIYSIILVGLGQRGHLMEAKKLARIMVKKSVRLRPPYQDFAIDILCKLGEKDLVNQLIGVQKGLI